ncbi:DUF1638 domain-containing protein [Desulfobulbus sp. US4]|nr:DUF1638 domain-containing protein [Desulfobulbus sp. US4]
MKSVCCFVVCENFFPEIQAAVRQQGLTDVEVRSFPSHCSSAPIKWSELVDIVRSSWADTVVIFGSYCLRELGAPPEGFSRCQIHQKEQCHHLLCSPTLVDAVQQNGTYLLSPGWLSCWRRHIATWGFDRPTAMEFFGESLRKLLLLDTGTDPDSERHLAEFGSFLQLPTEILPIGLEFLGLSLSHIIADYQQQKIIRQKEEVERQAAESAMTLDLIRMVTRVKSKSEVVSAIIDLFTMLFDPKKIYFIPVSNAEVHFDQVSDLPPEEQLQAQQFYARPERYFLLNKEQGSFLLRIGRKEGTSALLLVSQVAHPLYIMQHFSGDLRLTSKVRCTNQFPQSLHMLNR